MRPRFIREVVVNLQDLIFLPGDWICRYGDYGDSMYFIVSGSCEVVGKDGVTPLRTLGKGDYFGEVALLTGVARTAYVRAQKFTIVAHLTKDGFHPILQKWPDQMDVILTCSGIVQEEERNNIKEKATKHYNLRRYSIGKDGNEAAPPTPRRRVSHEGIWEKRQRSSSKSAFAFAPPVQSAFPPPLRSDPASKSSITRRRISAPISRTGERMSWPSPVDLTKRPSSANQAASNKNSVLLQPFPPNGKKRISQQGLKSSSSVSQQAPIKSSGSFSSSQPRSGSFVGSLPPSEIGLPPGSLAGMSSNSSDTTPTEDGQDWTVEVAQRISNSLQTPGLQENVKGAEAVRYDDLVDVTFNSEMHPDSETLPLETLPEEGPAVHVVGRAVDDHGKAITGIKFKIKGVLQALAGLAQEVSEHGRFVEEGLHEHRRVVEDLHDAFLCRSEKLELEENIARQVSDTWQQSAMVI